MPGQQKLKVIIFSYNNNPLCINTSLYDVDKVFNVVRDIFDKMKIPCKASETYFGIPVIEYEGNSTMYVGTTKVDVKAMI